MYDDMTKEDIQKIQDEIEYRKMVVRPEAIQSVKEARAHGDLSETLNTMRQSSTRIRTKAGSGISRE